MGCRSRWWLAGPRWGGLALSAIALTGALIMGSVWMALSILSAKIAELEREVSELRAAVEEVRADKRVAVKPAKIDTAALIS